MGCEADDLKEDYSHEFADEKPMIWLVYSTPTTHI